MWFSISIPLLIFLHFFSLKFTKKKALAFANFEAIERFTGTRLLTKNLVLLTLRSVVLLLFIFALAGTTYSYQGLASEQAFILAIDSSGSMLATDFQPNRLESAKSSAASFVDFLPGKNTVGLVTFSGITFIKQTPTTDSFALKTEINNIEPNQIGGTAIGDAIITASNMLLSETKAKTIIVLTDGNNNVGASIEEAISYAQNNNIAIHTIGMGTEEGGTFPDLEDVVLKLDETELINIATKTNGQYFRATTPQEVDQAYQTIANVKETTISIDLQIILIIAALSLIITEWILTNSKYRTLP